MNWRLLMARLGGVGLVGATTTGAVMTSEWYGDLAVDVEGEKWDFLTRKSDQEIKKAENLNWVGKPIQRINKKGTKIIGHEMMIVGEDGRVGWQCNLMGILVGEPGADKSKIVSQIEEMKEKLREAEYRARFVDNCAKGRIDIEKRDGWRSEIELPIVVSGEEYELQDLKNVYEQDGFKGLKRLHKGEEMVWEREKTLIMEAKKVGEVWIKQRGMNRPFCVISGTPAAGTTVGSSSEFDTNTLKKFVEGGGNERKRYLMRNCLAAKKGRIEGMVVEAKNGKWSFKNLNDLLTKIYENPTVDEA